MLLIMNQLQGPDQLTILAKNNKHKLQQDISQNKVTLLLKLSRLSPVLYLGLEEFCKHFVICCPCSNAEYPYLTGNNELNVTEVATLIKPSKAPANNSIMSM